MIFDFEKPFTFDRVVRMLLCIGVAVFAFWMLKMLGGVLLPFFVAWLAAYMLYPLVVFAQNRLRLHFRSAAILFTLAAVGGVLTAAAWLVVPAVSGEVQKLVGMLGKGDGLAGIVPAEWAEYAQAYVASLDLEQMFSDPQTVINLGKRVFPHFWNVVSGTLAFVGGIFVSLIVFLYLFFILMDYEKLSDGWKSMISNRHKAFVLGLAEDVERCMSRYFRSQALIALIVGILFCIGFKIIGLPSAILLGLFLGALNLVPYLQIVGVVPAVLLAVVKAAECEQSVWWVLFCVLLVFVAVQIVQDFVLTPKIMGKSMRLNPAVILLSLSVFGYLFGILGMIIALPATTLCISYYKRLVLDEHQKEE